MDSNPGETKAWQGSGDNPRDSGPLPGSERPQPPLICGDFGIRIARDGTWFHEGSPIGRLPLVKLFASVLRREGDEYWLVTPAERGRILVEDAPFVAVGLDARGSGRDQALTFRTNLEEEIEAGPAHPIRVVIDPARGEPRPYVLVRDNLEALIARAVYYQLVELGREEAQDGAARYGVWSGGVFFALS
jgi:uncharacterized protein